MDLLGERAWMVNTIGTEVAARATVKMRTEEILALTRGREGRCDSR
jgi:hypothetical protein